MTCSRGKSPLLYEGMGRLAENSVVVMKNKSHAVSAQIEVPEGGGEGVIVAQGAAYAGWSLYLHEGHPAYCYKFFGLAVTEAVTTVPDLLRMV